MEKRDYLEMAAFFVVLLVLLGAMVAGRVILVQFGGA